MYILGSEYQESDESNSFIVQGFPNGTPPNRIEDYFNEMLVSGKDKVCEVQMDEDEGWCKVVFSNTDGRFDQSNTAKEVEYHSKLNQLVNVRSFK